MFTFFRTLVGIHLAKLFRVDEMNVMWQEGFDLRVHFTYHIFCAAHGCINTGYYFDNSYLGVVSSLVREEKISVDDLRDLIRQIESQTEKR